jgi:hypothetical protein
MTTYIGGSPENDSVKKNRFFYGLRRADDGTLYLGRFDSQSGADTLVINTSGSDNENYTDFEFGVDFVEGRDPDTHELVYPNLNYEQFRWDDKILSYYINDEGELVLKFGNRTYSEDV